MDKQMIIPGQEIGAIYKAKVLKYWDFSLEKEITMEAPTKEKLFENFYNANRTYRYCNGCYFKFADSSVKAEYDRWYKSLSEMTRFNMYYGDGIVD